MKLEKLSIELQRYGPEKGQYMGEAVFTGETGKVGLKLNKHHCDEIFRVCGESMIDVARAAARMLTAEVIENHTKLSLPNA